MFARPQHGKRGSQILIALIPQARMHHLGDGLRPLAWAWQIVGVQLLFVFMGIIVDQVAVIDVIGGGMVRSVKSIKLRTLILSLPFDEAKNSSSNFLALKSPRSQAAVL